MSYEVHLLEEDARGCGYRKPGASGVGLYFMGDAYIVPCERLPFPLTACPCCGSGIKFSRGFTWVEPKNLFAAEIEPVCTNANIHCDDCIMCNPSNAGSKAGLMWVGQKFYTPQSFIHESVSRGVSKKISAIPNGFKVGYHFIYLAHLKAVIDYEGDFGKQPKAKPGIFMAFRPLMVDLVIENENNIPDRAKHIFDKLDGMGRIVKIKKMEQDRLL